jgi:hypothetical protein
VAQRRLHLGQRGAAVNGMPASAWRSQCGDTASLMPAFLAARLTHAVDGTLGQVAALAAGEDGLGWRRRRRARTGATG